ncbi:MAG: glycoside hydrolase family 2 [Acidobacteria bacterium]|nr:glycoside hydrolase family 2 [Acidobacteriota bacterium]
MIRSTLLCWALASAASVAGEISAGWLMQDAARVTATGEAISKVGFATGVYKVKPYVAPATASANPAPTTRVPDEVRYFPAPRVEGRTQWRVDPMPGRPSYSSKWVQAPGPQSDDWYRATVPGTVLTTLVNNNVYPEPSYGENNRPNLIPESLCRTSYWYRTEFDVPGSYAGRQIWLNFEGINYIADVWVNGAKVGVIKGAFISGIFNVTALVKPGTKAAVAVLIAPPPHPGDPWEKTMANQRGPNGGGVDGPLGQDGPTFVAAIGWDWVPGVRDRQIGIWRRVTLTATGPVVMENPFVTTDVPLPRTDSADVSVEVTVRNTGSVGQAGVVRGTLGAMSFRPTAVTLGPDASQVVRLKLTVKNPRLWWPNGFGEPNLYPLHLAFELGGKVSDFADLNVGIRKVTYFVEGSKNLTLSVNGVPVFAKGGNWGMDEVLKRIPRSRLEAQIRLHKLANYTILRNWVGQSTTEDLYDLCDRYGIMVWDEFFQANPANGLDPLDAQLYLANVRDKVLRFRSHPAIVIWCGRNEGAPPAEIDRGIARIVKELDPGRYYQSSSTAGNGVISGGAGYHWREPRLFYGDYPAFNTEIGSASIPTLEAIQAWMPAKDLFDVNFPNDAWALRCLVGGNGNPVDRPLERVLAKRFGPYATLADFVRKAQLADYEAFRAMYEARMSRLFHPTTAIITWMSNPALPSLVWQIYDYSLEPFGSFFGVQKASETVHIMMTQDDFRVMLVNHRPAALEGYKYRVRLVNLDGAVQFDETAAVGTAGVSRATELRTLPSPDGLSAVHFVKLELMDRTGRVVSDNFYWKEAKQDDLTAMDTLPDVELVGSVVRRDGAGKCVLDVTLRNPGRVAAVMAHLQLRNAKTNQRVLPVYYSDNYVSLLAGEKRTITVEASADALAGGRPLVVVDGWNVTVKAAEFAGGARIATNGAAHVARQ